MREHTLNPKEKAPYELSLAEAVDAHTHQGERIMTSLQDTPDNDTLENEGHAAQRRATLEHLARLGFSNPDEATIATLQRANQDSAIGRMLAELQNAEREAPKCPAGLDWCDGDQCRTAYDLAFGGIPFHRQMRRLDHGDDVSICWSENDPEAYLAVCVDAEHDVHSHEVAEFYARIIGFLAVVTEMDNKLEWINNDIQARRNEVTC